jgi:hypothetical protein
VAVRLSNPGRAGAEVEHAGFDLNGTLTFDGAALPGDLVRVRPPGEDEAKATLRR